MPVPKNQQELFSQSDENYQKLLALVASLALEKQMGDFPAGTMNRNIRDVLAHLHHWHLMFLEWYEIGMKGEKPAMPAKGYSWKDTKALNQAIWETYQHTPLEAIKVELDNSHSKLQTIIHSHSDEDLFEKKRYAWTGTSSLATYIRSNTSSHYAWALNLIKKSLKG